MRRSSYPLHFYEDMFIRLDMIHEHDGQTHTDTARR